MRLVPALLLAAALALPAAGCSAAPSASDKAFGEKVRAYLIAHPEVLEEVMGKLQETREAQTDGRGGC